jgi:Kef-type K+ transport system membrane component KefB
VKFLAEHNLLIFLIQFALLLGLSKLAGLLFEKFKQSTITAEVLVGLLLGPAIFGKYFPQWQSALFPRDPLQISMLETIAWLGNFYLLMETGLDANFSRIWKQKGKALTISLTDLVVPVILAFLPIFLIPDAYLVDPSRRFMFSLFIAVIMTISALPVAIRVMYDLNILKSDTGFLVISALTINDLIGWVVFTIILGVFGQDSVDFIGIFRLVILTLGFTVLSLTVFKTYINKAMTLIHNKYGSEAGLKTTFVFLVGMIFGAMTLKIGIHSLFGFFLAGIVVGESKHLSQNDRNVMNRLVHSIFVPVFFANIGLHLDFISNFHWQLVLLFSVMGIAVRYIGAYLGSKLARQDRFEHNTIAICHTAGGEMHIVVAILALSSGLITQSIFVSIVVASLVSTIVLGPWLSYAMKLKRKGLLQILFNRESVILNANYKDKGELINFVSGIIAGKAKLEPQVVLEEIQKREEQMSTAAGKGIAFPHARLEGISHPMVIAVRNKTGLEWDSPDGKPVYWIFFIMTPALNPTLQLRILQMLSKALQTKELRQQIDAAAEPESVWNKLKPAIEGCEECVSLN